MVWVICSRCSRKHRLFPGIGAPFCGCGNRLVRVLLGDEIEYEREAQLGGYNE